MVEFKNCKRDFTDIELLKVEELLGFKLNDEHFNHLKKYNGGSCYPNIFTFFENSKATNARIHYFYAIYDGEYNNLETIIQILKIDYKRMPNLIYPIACEPTGNEICIHQQTGEIYFWDHENEVDYTESADSNWSNLYKISNSLNDFFNSLNEI